eukprot:1052038-Rhodomonas_salina.1
MQGTLSDSEALHFQAYRIVFARELQTTVVHCSKSTSATFNRTRLLAGMLPDHPANPISRDFYNANMAGKTKFISLSALLPEGGNSAEDIEKVATVLPLPGQRACCPPFHASSTL